MNETSEARRVLEQYPGDWRDARIERLGSAGGFSGAALWRIRAPGQDLCLKRWPAEHPTEDDLRFMHSVLLHVGRQGLDWAPAPRPSRGGATWVVSGGRFWELAPWMPGRADFRSNPQPARLRAALDALAQFHRAAQSFPDFAPRHGVPPSISQRRERVQRLAAGGLDALSRWVVPDVWPELFEPARRAVRLASEVLLPVCQDLENAIGWKTPLQPCIRDVWHDHVLFTGERVTGLIDFGALRVDCVAVDVARLLGSLAGDDGSLWEIGLEAYESIRPLETLERAMVRILDWSGAVLAAIHWIEWLYRDRRWFADREAVVRRVREVVDRLEHLTRRLREGGETAGGLWLPGPVAAEVRKSAAARGGLRLPNGND